ncbi:redoxin family protein [Saccharopolyspora indica]|uniref:TlpA family protein disulfide reductase n=1 Tax=Saccharopolyspora indica TaxID=1229659 RepID=UPI0022EA8F2C|nr:redoxin family protein [Saccharopolyspora indica]MDA3644076.1 redoxin family protein [Saccharopolyspora indica]
MTSPGRWTAWRIARWSALLVTVIAIGAGAVFGSRLGADPALVDSPLIGQPAPVREVPELEGPGSLSLPDLRGEVVVVNFWASWCVPCREEHAVLTSAAANYRDAGVTFVGVNYQDRPGSATAFLDELGRGDGYRYVTDPGSQLALEFGVFGVPETFFLDRTGRIVGKITGPANYPVLSAALDEMLAGRQPGVRVRGELQSEPGW